MLLMAIFDKLTELLKDGNIGNLLFLGRGNERYAFKAVTADGRSLTAFVSKADYTAAKI